MSEKERLVIFMPTGIRGRVPSGTRLDHAALRLGIDLQSVCGGQGKCGKCRVSVQGGQPVNSDRVPSPAALSAPSAFEIETLSRESIRDGWRLACQARLLADVTVLIPEESRAGRQVIRKDPGTDRVKLDPAVYRKVLSIPPVDARDTTTDLESTVDGAIGCFDPKLFQSLPADLQLSGGKVTALLRKEGGCIGVLGGEFPSLAGVALDIGTTTLAAYLCDLENGQVLATASAVNPQATCGEDVISRIAYAGSCKDGRDHLQRLVIDAVNRMILDLSQQTGIPPFAMADMTWAGNTCMHHLFLGIDPACLGRAPFSPAVRGPLAVRAGDLGVRIASDASIHMLPVVSGFIGADTIGVLIAAESYLAADRVLVVDVGTNGEIVLGDRGRLVCASCATGPALEGATIRHGMRAATGAVERVKIDSSTFDVACRVIGDSPQHPVLAAGLCGSGIIDAVAQMFAAGIITENGRMNRTVQSPRLQMQNGELAFVIVPAKNSATGKDITVDQKDIRAVQMAKGALHAGIRLLMAETGIDTVERIFLAGAFGSVIDPVSALTIGLFPAISPEHITVLGNAAGDGARQALLNREKREKAAHLADRIDTVELTTHPRFSKEFARAMYFPHMDRP